MNETSKTKLLLNKEILRIFDGEGIDIGCGNNPVSEFVTKFDVSDGDANEIAKYCKKQFDFVYSSHCLEHMNNPYSAISEWWRLVNDYGYLIITIPDEDLYEQGFFPSRFNRDHKFTFTISKNKSWSPVSVNVLQLIASLENAKTVKLELQDNNYDRHLNFIKHSFNICSILSKELKELTIFSRVKFLLKILYFSVRYKVFDQTMMPDTVAQILFVLQKIPNIEKPGGSITCKT